MRSLFKLFLSRFLLLAALLLGACAQLPVTPPLDAARYPAIDAAIESFIEKRQLPGAVFRLQRLGMHYEKAYGHYTYEPDATRMQADTIFDAASLTKVIATTPSVIRLIEAGKLTLDTPLVKFFPECANGGKDTITIRHLLTHTSGLPAGLSRNPPWQGEAAALKSACNQIVTHAPGTVFRYSDINFVLLGQLVQRVSGMPLNEFARQHFYEPLGMKHTTFLPLRQFAAARIAPTQRITDAGLKDGLHNDLALGYQLQGVVHDPTARLMDGVAGSAGLFTTVGDLARFARMMLNEGELDGVRVLARDSVSLMTHVQSPDAVATRRSAGWDMDSSYSRPRGTLFPIGSYGHTGFTGCILWIDPFSKTFYVFLSNRVYPKDGTNIVPLYSMLGSLSAQAVAGFDFGNVPGALPGR